MSDMWKALALRSGAAGVAGWSYSKLKLLENCPFAFQKRYMAWEKENPELILDPVAAKVGKFIHWVFETVVTGYGRNGLDMFGKVWELGAENQSLVNEEYERAYAMRDKSKRLLVRLFDGFDQYGLVPETEATFSMYKATGTFVYVKNYYDKFLSGVIDLKALNKRKTDGIICDYKTHGWSEENEASVFDQLSLYAFVEFMRTPSLNHLSCGPVFIPDESISLNKKYTREQDFPKLEAQWHDRIEEAIAKLEGYNLNTVFPPMESKHCTWCGFDCAVRAKKKKGRGKGKKSKKQESSSECQGKEVKP